MTKLKRNNKGVHSLSVLILYVIFKYLPCHQDHWCIQMTYSPQQEIPKSSSESKYIFQIYLKNKDNTNKKCVVDIFGSSW